MKESPHITILVILDTSPECPFWIGTRGRDLDVPLGDKDEVCRKRVSRSQKGRFSKNEKIPK